MGVGAAIGGIASVYAASKSASAAKDAAGAQTDATRSSIAENRRQFDQTRDDLSPFRKIGTRALTGVEGPLSDPRLERLENLRSQLSETSETIQQTAPSGLNLAHPAQGGLPLDDPRREMYTGSIQNPEYRKIQDRISDLEADIEQNPFEQNRVGPGLVGLVTDPDAQRNFITENPFFSALADDAQDRLFSNQAAKGKLGSGETAEALQNSLLLLGEDLLSNRIGQYQNLVGMGQNAAAQTGSFGAQNARTIADLRAQGANARAAGTVGAANAWTSGINNAVSTGVNLYALNKMYSGGSD